MELEAAQSLCHQRHNVNQVLWLGYWISNPELTCSKPVDGCKLNSAFLPQISIKLVPGSLDDLVFKSKLPP